MNPFKEGSNQYKDFETMSDCKWHCSKCELLRGQAKTWQVWRQEKGILSGAMRSRRILKTRITMRVLRFFICVQDDI